MGGSLPDDVSTSPIGCDFEGLLIVKTWRWSGQDAGFGGRHLSSACESGGVPGAGGTMAVREESARRVDMEARLAGKASGRWGTISVILCCTESAAAVGVEAASSKA